MFGIVPPVVCAAASIWKQLLPLHALSSAPHGVFERQLTNNFGIPDDSGGKDCKVQRPEVLLATDRDSKSGLPDTATFPTRFLNICRSKGPAATTKKVSLVLPGPPKCCRRKAQFWCHGNSSQLDDWLVVVRYMCWDWEEQIQNIRADALLWYTLPSFTMQLRRSYHWHPIRKICKNHGEAQVLWLQSGIIGNLCFLLANVERLHSHKMRSMLVTVSIQGLDKGLL